MPSKIIIWSANDGDLVNVLREENVDAILLPPSVETISQLSEAAKSCQILFLDISEGSCSWNAFCVFRNAQPDGDVVVLASDPAGENSQEVLRYLESGARDYVDAMSARITLDLKLQPLIERHEALAALENTMPCRHSQRNRWFECFFGKFVAPSGSRRPLTAGFETRASSSSSFRYRCPECEKASDAANMKADLMSLKARLTVLKSINDEMQKQGGQIQEDKDPDMFQLIISASGEDPETAAWIESEFVGSTRGNPPSCRPRSMDGIDPSFLPDSDRPRGFASCSSPETPVEDPESRRRQCLAAIAENGLDSWDTDILNLPEERLVDVATLLLEERGALTVLRTSRARLERFVRSVRSRYHDNPYHNFRHAVDVLKCLHIFFTKGRAEQLFLADEVVGGMLAALGHDVDHPGRNNPFLISTRHHLARLYNDRSVLENHHAATLYLIVQDESCNIFANLTPEEWVNMRQIITTAILATDMAQHLDILSRVKDLAPRGAFHSDDNQHRLLLLNALLHAADISNPIKPWELSKAWSARVTDEFLEQGDAERRLGQPVTPFMDRLTASEARNTLNFIDFAAAPLYAVLKDVLPALAPCYEILLANRERWVALLESQEPVGSKTVSEQFERRRSLIDRRRSRSRSRSFSIFKSMQQADQPALPSTPSLPASALLSPPRGASPAFHPLPVDGDGHQDGSGAGFATSADDSTATMSKRFPYRKSSQSITLPTHVEDLDLGVAVTFVSD